MTVAGLWVPRKQRPPKVYQPRNRRACYGELIQVDGCDHRWFEDRPQHRKLIHRYLEVAESPDGRIELWTDGIALPYTTYDRPTGWIWSGRLPK